MAENLDKNSPSPSESGQRGADWRKYSLFFANSCKRGISCHSLPQCGNLIIINYLSLHLVKMAVPPGIAAFVTAKAFFLLLFYQLNKSTVLTIGCRVCTCRVRFDREIVAAAEDFAISM
ncbi:MAG: hypothetical protein QME45_04885 [Clostridiales bacterium]|nr:hypothetical protein [Clostridiales bacterium]